jgi:S-adenosylmethionine/arginine decarboxylase-like enzyme
MFVPNHLHLLVKATCKNPATEVEQLNDWFRRLVEKVRMVVVAGPTSVYVNEEGNEGLTGTVTLATSHASIHIWEKNDPPMFQFDLYSCSCFTVEEVLEHLDEFDLTDVEYLFIDRNNGFKIKESKTWAKADSAYYM